MSFSAVIRVRASLLSRVLPLLALGLVLANVGPAFAQRAEDPEAALSTDLGRKLEAAAQAPDVLPWQREALQRYARTARVALPEAGPRTSASSDGDWAEIGPPAGRAGHSVILDPIGRRMLIFGGTDGVYRNDVWQSSLRDSSWTPLRTTGLVPVARVGHSAIYDPVRRRMIVFGGKADGYRNDVWSLSLTDGSWSEISAGGTAPSARYLHTAVYDSAGDRMLVFGGRDDAAKNDVWALSLAGSPSWSQVSPGGASPSVRYGHTAIYDPVRVRMVAFGGSDGVDRNNEVWSLALGGAPVWSRVQVLGGPSARYLHGAVYDSVHDRMLVYGGWGGVYLDEVWALSLGASPAWTKLNPSGTKPAARAYPATVYDPASEFMVVYGGFDGSYRNDNHRLLLFSVPTWFNFTIVTLPPGLHSHSAVFDAAHERMVVFGGTDGFVRQNTVWVRSLAGTEIWNAIGVNGAPPSARIDHAAIYDSKRDRMLIFGGWDGDYRADLWSLSLSGASPAWSVVSTVGLPPRRRAGASAIYDAERDRMVIFGGLDTASTYRNDLWAVSLSDSNRWVNLTPGSGPSGRADHTAIYDPLNERMVVYGGWGGGFLNDTWSLSLGGTPAWTELATGGTSPGGRFGHTAVLDLARSRMVVYGGWDGSDRGDVFALALSGAPTWTALAPTGMLPAPRQGHVAIYDSRKDRMEISGGIAAAESRRETWALTWGEPDSIGVECPPPTAWSVGDSVTLVYRISSPYGFSQSFGYTISSGRHWPGYPLTGNGVLPANTILSFSVRVPVPDTAAGGANVLTFTVVPRGAPQSASCSNTLFDPTAWSDLTPSAGAAPSPRSGHTAVYDPVRRRMLVFGGTDGTIYLNDLWSFALATPAWAQLTPAGGPPSPRAAHTAIYDPVRDRVLVFGGTDGVNRNSEVWALTLAGTPTWTLLAPTGAPPAARSGSAAIYDPIRDRMLVFGGALPGFSTQETWSLSLAGTPTWSLLVTGGGSPSGRDGATAVYDPALDRMLVFGGSLGFRTNEILQLTLAGTPSWSSLTTPGSPQPEGRSESSAIYDAARERMVIFGGVDGTPAPRNDSWVLVPSIRFWARQEPTGTIPAERSAHTAILDLVGDRMVIFGGVSGTTYFNDVRALSWGPAPGSIVTGVSNVTFEAEPGRVRLTWHEPATAGVAASVYRRSGEEDWSRVAQVIGDESGQVAYEDQNVQAGRLYHYRIGVSGSGGESFHGEIEVSVPTEFRFALLGARPNPAFRDLAIAFSLANRDAATLEMFDLSGRRLWSRQVESLGPGNHVTSLRGAVTRPGVYMIRLSQGARRLTSRAVVLH